MIQHKVTIFINRPVEQVFEFTADEKNLSKWQANFIEGEQLTEGSIVSVRESVKLDEWVQDKRKFKPK